MEHTLIAPKTFRYALSQTDNSPNHALFVLHGYGQLAREFIHEFEGLRENLLIVAPEGMHRFYLKGTQGAIGASWMTREDRQSDIQDNMRWLEQLREHIRDTYAIRRFSVLGFSQGGATALRWSISCGGFDSTVVWASQLPEELNHQTLPKNQKYQFVIGSDDLYFPGEIRDAAIQAYDSIGFEVIRYDGKHQIEQQILRDIILNLH